MPALITNEILDQVAIVAPAEQVPDHIFHRYDGLLDRVTLYTPFTVEDLPRWRSLVQSLRGRENGDTRKHLGLES